MTPEQAERRWLEETERSRGAGVAYTVLGSELSKARDAAVEYGPGHPRAMERMEVVLAVLSDLRYEVRGWKASQAEQRSDKESA